ncbi:Uncharacterised protein [Orientia tsutsugamushi]|uniref:Uncharacterized protein n=2 Tax=Orientia tsutsugamushi TaxID=784 RepID=A0A2R8F2K8_ORITS|nr:hypothetical protein OTSKATO_0957 [Orientia tsutsugamushi str. Kato PP]KJV75837.1 hypothetical protein OTSTA763_0175 [Orientia tsutsugamushi str. TA763]KJV77389.1 hypothetical protein OTSTA716_0266 [Orientia tsutsugamushi str. TA716]KJV91100.1 hypothetical protein OTSUT76_0978 [Orientia tsutsugamushi str. UT76]SPM45433.1 Uncharacterised protein [Orientia tsutsugamushi]
MILNDFLVDIFRHVWERLLISRLRKSQNI